MKPKITDLKLKVFEHRNKIIKLLITSYKNPWGDVRFGDLAYFNHTFAVVYEDYMVSVYNFNFERIKKVDDIYVYRLPPNLPFRLVPKKVRIYEGDY